MQKFTVSQIAILSLMILSACERNYEICCGYEWSDGGGSEISISHFDPERDPTRLVVILPPVTTVGHYGNFIFGERRAGLDAEPCTYFSIDVRSDEITYFEDAESLYRNVGGLNRDTFKSARANFAPSLTCIS